MFNDIPYAKYKIQMRSRKNGNTTAVNVEIANGSRLLQYCVALTALVARYRVHFGARLKNGVHHYIVQFYVYVDVFPFIAMCGCYCVCVCVCLLG